jgi:hypothetical protein
MSVIRTEPTLQDIANACKFMAGCTGSAKDAEAMAWVIAVTRAEERERCAKVAEKVSVADRLPAMVRNEIVDQIRALGPVPQTGVTTTKDNG